LFIPLAWLAGRGERTTRSDLLLLTTFAVIGGALIWGLRVGDYNTFHFFFAPIVALATPLAVVATWDLRDRLRSRGFGRLAGLLVGILALQTSVGFVTGIERLRAMGPGTYEPIPLEVLDAIRDLPADAVVAYRCNPGEEFAHYDGMLISITAHTRRPVAPMCFYADWLRELHGQVRDLTIPSPFGMLAPQRALYPTADARPSTQQLSAFLRSNGIGYQFVDPEHPEHLIPGAVIVGRAGEVELLRLP
jgi:hypothetical protein